MCRSVWDLVCITPARGSSPSLYSNNNALRARQQRIRDVQMFCKRLRCWERRDHSVATEPGMCSEVENSNRSSAHFHSLLQTIYGSRVFIVVVPQHSPPKNVLSATNYSILIVAVLWKHHTKALKWRFTVMCKHVRVTRRPCTPTQSISSPVRVSDIPIVCLSVISTPWTL